MSTLPDMPDGTQEGACEDTRESVHENVHENVRALLARVRDGDADAYTQLVRPLMAPLVRYASAEVESPAAGEDIVQEVLLSFWNRRASLGEIGSLKTYLFGAVHHRVINHHRSIRREQQRVAYGDVETMAWDTDALFNGATDAALNEAELRAAYARALARMPDRPRQVFSLIREHGLSYREAADALGVSVKTVEMHMGRALIALRTALRDWRE